MLGSHSSIGVWYVTPWNSVGTTPCILSNVCTSPVFRAAADMSEKHLEAAPVTTPPCQHSLNVPLTGVICRRLFTTALACALMLGPFCKGSCQQLACWCTPTQRHVQIEGRSRLPQAGPPACQWHASFGLSRSPWPAPLCGRSFEARCGSCLPTCCSRAAASMSV